MRGTYNYPHNIFKNYKQISDCYYTSGVAASRNLVVNEEEIEFAIGFAGQARYFDDKTIQYVGCIYVYMIQLKGWICGMIFASKTHRSSRLFHLVAGVWFMQLRICENCNKYYHYQGKKDKPQRLHFERPPPPSVELLCDTMTKLLACILAEKALAIRVFNLDYCSSFKYGVQVCYIVHIKVLISKRKKNYLFAKFIESFCFSPFKYTGS